MEWKGVTKARKLQKKKIKRAKNIKRNGNIKKIGKIKNEIIKDNAGEKWKPRKKWNASDEE